MDNSLPVLIEVSRGAIVESRHRGAVVALEPDGRVLSCLGDDQLIISTRSTIKPIQAIPLVTSQAADHFRLSPRELAVACASHDGEPMHTEAVAAMLDRAGLSESDLRCGAHRPYSEETARRLECEGKPFTQLHNNCSGKHAGMLMTALKRGLPVGNYIAADHPLQREIMKIFTSMAGLKDDPLIAIDGCSAPTFGLPLRSLALSFARLAGPWQELDSEMAEAVKRIVAAMTAHPEMVGGTKKVFDTDLMRVARGRVIAKVGAESAYALGVLPCRQFPRGLGIALKVDDGAARARHPAVVEVLAQLGLLDEGELAALKEYHNPVVKNHRGVEVGEMRAVFDLGFGRGQR
ncbi:MAG TPA: asparaginase [Blastocatellia bacterium]|nr:asparaginase [Blastocatellia bacterium]